MDGGKRTNQNEPKTYMYYETIDGHMYLWNRFVRKEQWVTRQKITKSIAYSVLLSAMWFVVFGLISESSTILSSIVILSFPCWMIAGIVIGCNSPRWKYRDMIRIHMLTDPVVKMKRFISFDGYYLYIDSDLYTARIVITDDDVVECTPQGILIQCLFGKQRYFVSIKCFGSLENMAEFYNRLTWNKRYSQIYK